MSIVNAISFEDFLSNIPLDHKVFVSNTHEVLTADGYKIKIESKASGLFASYSHPKTKRVLLNLFFRKNGFFTRIYADNHGTYSDFLNSLPEAMEKEIAKSSVCKRLVNPVDCNSKCVMGYDFHIRDTHYQKCRYNCFQFSVNSQSIGFLSDFIENERQKRQEAY